MATIACQRVGDVAPAEFDRRLATTGVGIRIGPFDAHLQADAPTLRGHLHRLYADYPLLPEDRVYSFHARLDQLRGPIARGRRLRFSVDGRVPHEDMPAEQALPVLEWGMNLVIALRSHRYLMLHAAVLARDGKALLMPAEPGFGKSTLCAALAHRGWELYSDEFGLLTPEDGRFIPVPRPVALKNESIEVIRRFAPDCVIGPSIPGTRKGTVAHVRVPPESVRAMGGWARAAWVVFPRWLADSDLSLEPVPPAESFMRLATNAFNYEMLGERAFDSVASIVDDTRAFRLTYSRLDDALDLLENRLVTSLD